MNCVDEGLQRSPEKEFWTLDISLFKKVDYIFGIKTKQKKYLSYFFDSTGYKHPNVILFLVLTNPRFNY